MSILSSDLKTFNELLSKHPQLPALLKSGYFRKYQVQDALRVTKAEADTIVNQLLIDNVVKTTPFGFKMLKSTHNELVKGGFDI